MKASERKKERKTLWHIVCVLPWPADLHVQDLLEGLRVAVSQELDIVINKHHRRFMRGHHHLWRRRRRSEPSCEPDRARVGKALNDPTWALGVPERDGSWVTDSTRLLQAASENIRSLGLYLGTSRPPTLLSLFFYRPITPRMTGGELAPPVIILQQ